MDEFTRPDTKPDRPPDALWFGELPVWYGPMQEILNPVSGKATAWFRWVFVGTVEE